MSDVSIPKVEAALTAGSGGAPLAGWRLVGVHLLSASLVQSPWMAMLFILPVLARKRFEADSWETMLVTAAPNALFCLSIFWNDLFSRRRFGAYLFTYWLVASAPIAFIGLAENYWGLLIPHLISAVGGAGFHPAAGDLLKSLYSDRVRGRVYSLVWGCSMLIGAGAGYAAGEWLKQNEDGFRILMPLVAGVQLLGVMSFALLSRATGHAARREAAVIAAAARHDADESHRLRKLLAPIAHMGTILRADPVFARYEAAFMTYGVGWMIAYALVPIIVTQALNLNYDQIATSTLVPYWLTMVAMIVPAGMLMDRLGAARSTGISFALLAGHPLGLVVVCQMAAGGGLEGSGNAYWVLLGVTAYYGFAHAGANVGWMLGPVSLAPSPGKVAQYVSIHATMVGIRGTIFQGVGIGLFELTGSFTWPLLMAAAAYGWSAWQMYRLHGRMQERAARAAAVLAAGK